MTVYTVTGTQADKASNNKLLVMKLSQLARTRHDDGSDEDDDEDDDSPEDDPILEHVYIKHEGTVNRVRVRCLLPVLPFYNSMEPLGYASRATAHLRDLVRDWQGASVGPFERRQESRRPRRWRDPVVDRRLQAHPHF